VDDAIYEIMKCTVKSRIRLFKRGWKIAEECDDFKYVKNLNVKLSIDGNEENGYHLTMEPEDCFAADNHYESLEEAIESAYELFGVSITDWV